MRRALALSTISLAAVLIIQVVLLGGAYGAITNVNIATDGSLGSTSVATSGGQKLIEDSTGRFLAVYIDSSGRIGVSFANSDPTTSGWSAPAKSPTPSSGYARPAAVLVSLTSLRIIVEGGAGAGNINDVPVTISRDSSSNIMSLQFGSPTVLDGSGFGRNPSAILAHNGNILAAWNWVSTDSRVKTFRWSPTAGWTSFTGSSNTPDDAVIDSSNPVAIFPSIIQRPDNHHVYLIGNRASGSTTTTLVFNKATFNGSTWSWGTQNLSYETNAARGIEDATSLAWDPVKSSVVAAYDISGTNQYGVFALDSSDKKTHTDTPSLVVSDNDWGSIIVDGKTGEYWLFLINAASDGATGSVGYTTLVSGSWSTTLTIVDPGTTNFGLSLRRTGNSSPFDVIYSKGASAPTTITFARVGSSSVLKTSALTIASSPNPAGVGQSVTISGRLTDPTTGAGLSGRTVTVQSVGNQAFNGTSWNPNVSCNPALTTIEQVIGNIPNSNGGASKSGGAFPPIGDTDSDKRNLFPPCTINGTTTFVEVHGVYIENPPPIDDDCSSSFDPINGGRPYPNGSQCDTFANLQTPGTPTGGCTLTVKDSCLHRIHFEIDRDWKGAGFCGPGTVCDGALIRTITSTSTLIDIQGFVFWDQGHLNDDWHSFSGWEFHPLSGWRFTQQTSTGTIATVTTASDGSYQAVTSFSTGGTYNLRAVFNGDTSYQASNSPTISESIVTSSQPDFSISSSPTNIVLQAGSKATATITMTSLNKFSGTITLSVFVSPSGLSASASPTSVSLSSGKSATSTLTVSSITVGSYTVTVTGTSGSLSHSVKVGITVTASSDFTIAANPTSLNFTAGSSATSTIALQSLNGFAGTVSLSAAVSPSGPTASLSPGSITLISGGSGTSTLTVSSTTPGSFTIVVTGTSSSKSHSATITVTVSGSTSPDFAITANPASLSFTSGFSATSAIAVSSLNSFSGTISLSTSASPSGLTASVSPSTVTVGPGGSVVSTLTVSSTTAGTYSVIVTGSSGSLSHSASLTVTVTVSTTKDFTISAGPASLSLTPGSSGTSTITLTAINGFTGTVGLTESVTPPSGLTISCSPASFKFTHSVTLANSTCTFSSSTVSSYTVTITGRTNSIFHSVIVTVNVVDFTISASPSSLSILAGSPGTSTITVTGLNGFAGTVSLTTSAPSALTASVSPANITAAGTSTLTVSSTTAGNYTITVTGTSGSLSHSVSVSVRALDFSLSTSLTNIVIQASSSATSSLTLSSLNGFTGTVSLSTLVSLSGLTASTNPGSVTLGSGTSALSTLTVTSPTAATYTVVVTALSGSLSHSVTITVKVVDFGISASPSSQNIPVGSSGSSTLTLTGLNSFTGTIALASSVTPSTGLSVSCSPTSVALSSTVTSASSNCTFTSSLVGTYTLTITGTSGSLSHSATVTVTVFDFTISANPNSIVVPSGFSQASTLTLTSQNGFTGTITLALTVPSGLSASTSPSSLVLNSGGSGTSTLTVSSATLGTYTITVTATSGSLSHSTTINVKVVDFSISASTTSSTVQEGSSGTSSITLTSLSGFSGTISLSTSTSPSGLTASMNLSSVTLSPGGSGTATVTFSSSTAGTYLLTVTGANSPLSHSISIQVKVVGFTIATNLTSLTMSSGSSAASTATLNGLNGFTGTVSLSASVSPSSGLTVVCSPTSFALSPNATSASSTCTFNSSTPGTYAVTITGTSGSLGHSITVTVNVVDFTITASPTSLAFFASTSGTSTITLTPVNGFTGSVQLTATSQQGLNTQLSASTITLTGSGSGQSILTLSSTTPGTYTVTITASSGPLSHTTTVSVQVVDFSITANPSSLTIQQGSSATSSIGLTSLGGFSGTINLDVTSSPSDPRTSLNPKTITLSAGGSGTSTLKISIPRRASTGLYTVTVTATGTLQGTTLSHSVTITVTVVAPAAAFNLVSSRISAQGSQPEAGSSLTTVLSIFLLNSLGLVGIAVFLAVEKDRLFRKPSMGFLAHGISILAHPSRF